MKKQFLSIIMLLLVQQFAQAQFVMSVKTNNAGSSSSTQFTIPTNTAYGAYNYGVNWGDGNTNAGVTGDITHTYAAAGTYTVTITGTFPTISFGTPNGGDKTKVLAVTQWGTNPWVTFTGSFNGCSNMDVTAADVPVLTGVVDFNNMFNGCRSLVGNSSFGSWNTSTIKFMTNTFLGAALFNQNIGSWNTSSVVGMQGMFASDSAFNQNIGSWDVSKVTTMQSMFASAIAFNNGGSATINSWNTAAVTTMQSLFYSAKAFNQNIGSWSTGAVTNMNTMFGIALKFNNGGSGTINSWNTAAVTTMNSMFSNDTAFNQNIGSWNVSAVTNMGSMFASDTSFNQNIGSWNVSAVTNMSFMFSMAKSFNQNIGSWNVGAVTTMSNMFANAKSFNNGGSAAINGWNTAAVTTMNSMFSGANAFNQNIGSWATGTVTDMSSMFSTATIFNNGGSNTINGWNTAAVTTMASMFANDTAFNQNIASWNTSHVTTMNKMFFKARGFNQDIGSWNTGVVTDMASMFNGAAKFNNGGTANINNWNTANVTIMGNLFASDSAFNQNINGWNTANVTTMAFMFSSAVAFNQNIGPGGGGIWNTIKVTDMSFMFWGATVFNNGGSPSINNWNTAAVTNMGGMFQNAVAFNQNINSWNTAAVITMASMFNGASVFNQSLTTSGNSWKTGAVTSINSMFFNASAFNQSLKTWDVSKVTDFSSAFRNAIAFNQSLGYWTIAAATSMTNFLDLSGMDETRYDSTITGWKTNNQNPAATTFGASGLKYCASVADRSYLISNFNLTPVSDILGCGPGGITSALTRYWLLANRYTGTNGSAVSSVFDYSGNNFNFTQAIPANQPTFTTADNINFNPLFAFNGVNNYLTGSGTANNGQTNFNVPVANRTVSSFTVGFPVTLSLLLANGAWIPATASNTEYITLDLGAIRPVNGVVTQGSATSLNWTTTFTVFSSTDNVTYTQVGGTFIGNTDQGTQVVNTFSGTVVARYLRVYPQSWNVLPALRIDAFTTGLTQFTAFVVSKEDVRQNNTTLSLGYTDANNLFSMASPNGSGNVTLQGLVGGVAGSSINITTPAVSAVGVPTIAGFTEFFGANSKIYLNGKARVQGNSAIVDVNTQSLGGLPATSSFFNGKIAEAVMYNATFTNIQLLQMNSYLSLKYGLLMSNDLNGNGIANDVVSGSVKEGDYVASDGSTIAWTYANNISYNNDVFGVARDDNASLQQTISKPTNSTDILTLSTDNNFTGMVSTHASIANNMSYIVMGNNTASATSTQTINMPAQLCGSRIIRQWKVQRAGTSIPLYVRADVSALAGTNANDYVLMIDQDGDGDFTTGTVSLVTATSLSGGFAVFPNVAFDADGSGTDIVTILVNNKPVELVSAGASVSATTYCIKNGYSYYNDPATSNAVISFNPNGNSFSPASITIDNTGTLTGGGDIFSNTGTGYYQSNDGQQTFRITKRLTSVVAPGTFNTNGGVTIRVYYTAADTMNLLTDPLPAGIMTQSGWFKCTDNNAAAVVTDMNAGILKNATFIAPSAYGTENGLLYVEFKVTSFSTFGYYASTRMYTLPVKLESFTATANKCNAVLNWKTSEEINTSKFVVEQSADAVNYTTAGNVAAKNAANGASYQLTIPQNTGRAYYRLKITDNNGSFTYSPTVTVATSCAGTDVISIYPNPLNGASNVNISFSTSYRGNMSLMVINPLGQVLLVKQLKISAANNLVPINTDRFAPGTYLVRFTTEDGNTLFDGQKFVK